MPHKSQTATKQGLEPALYFTRADPGTVKFEGGVYTRVIDLLFVIQKVELIQKPGATYPNWVEEDGPHDAGDYDNYPPGNGHTAGKVYRSLELFTLEDLVSDHGAPAGIAVEPGEDNLQEKEKKPEKQVTLERSPGAGAVRVRPAVFSRGG